MKLHRFPKIKGYIMKHKVSTLWPSYIGKRRTTFAKAYGIKVSYGVLFWEHFENLGTLALNKPPPPKKEREAP
jgi:hypothetical protein